MAILRTHPAQISCLALTGWIQAETQSFAVLSSFLAGGIHGVLQAIENHTLSVLDTQETLKMRGLISPLEASWCTQMG